MIKRKLNILALVLLSLATLTPSNSKASTNDLAQCLIDHLNGKERKFLATWIFFAIGSHPEITQYSKATQEDIESSNIKTGKLFTRLLTEDCHEELATASRIDPYAIEKSFELVGKVAMQELMTDESVSQALTGYLPHTDVDKIQQIMSGQK